MSKEKVYETLYKVMGDCWEWAYDKPEHAVAYLDGLWTMASVLIEETDGYNITMRINPPKGLEEKLTGELKTETDA